MRALPTGTVTFAFTDIEGSAPRWERNRAAMRDAVRRHDALLHALFAGHGGHVFKTTGDGFCAVFATAPDAISAALDAQRALFTEDFSAVDGLRVRIAVHTGLADERDSDYFGPTVNRVARLLAISHGGQILISGVTRDIAHDDLPAGATLEDLGSQRLQDLAEPEHVWQLSIAGLPSSFPPLRSLDASANNLPIQRTTFVGREQDVAEVKCLSKRHPLLTLVGSGGVGKTRLALQVGAELLDLYSDGVWFVDFATISDPELVASVVAKSFGMSQEPGRRIEESIPPWLKRKQLLLIFDNCEHLLEPVAALADMILAAVQGVHILATSRQALDISGEVVHRLPSLGVPFDVTALPADEAVRYGAVALFVDRATAADTRFVLTDNTAPIVAEICRHLDGIPLAIELAAARVKVLSMPHLAQRLNERFKILTGGSRGALPRQKTLSATIDWSYDLLTPQEQLLFARLGIFAGGFGLDTAAAVCGGDDLDESDILDLMTSLIDKSLVVVEASDEQERYRLLESTAAYALEKLRTFGQRDRMARRHAEYFRDLSEAADERFGSRPRFEWLAGVEPELDNYRAALNWALTQEHDILLGGAIVGALAQLWFDAGLIVEGRYWIDLALERMGSASQPRIAARLQLTLARLLSGARRYEASKRAMRLYESAGDAAGFARAQRLAGSALYQMGRLVEARQTTLQAAAVSRASKDAWSRAHCLSQLAYIETDLGNFDAGREFHRQALAGMKTLGDELGASLVLGDAAEQEFAVGHYEQALRLICEALELGSVGRDHRIAAAFHANAAAYCIALGDPAGARESARKGLGLARRVRNEVALVGVLQHLALLAALGGDARSGAHSLGYVDGRYEWLRMKRQHTEQWGYDSLLTALRKALSEDEIKKLAAEGAAWSEDQAVDEALKV
jgi:predicted ATPase/class 3 adenylate cyclase